MSYIAYKKKPINDQAENFKGKNKKKKNNQRGLYEKPVDVVKLQHLKEIYPKKDEGVLMQSLQEHNNDINVIVTEFANQAKLEELLSRLSSDNIDIKSNILEKYDITQFEKDDENEGSVQYRILYNELVEQLKEQNIVSEEELQKMMQYCSSNIGVWVQIQGELISFLRLVITKSLTTCKR